jgi:hypothetical protein
MAVTLTFGEKPPQIEFEHVWVGLVQHACGTNIYAEKTEQKVWKDITQFCRYWWEDEAVPGSPDGLTDEEIREKYFDHTHTDSMIEPQLVAL